MLAKNVLVASALAALFLLPAPAPAEDPDAVIAAGLEGEWIEVTTRSVAFSPTGPSPDPVHAPVHRDPDEPPKAAPEPGRGLAPLAKMGGPTGVLPLRAFDGASDRVTNVRLPDVSIAVGSAEEGEFVVEAFHSGLQVFDRQNTLNLPQMSFRALFGTTEDVVDPRLVYDPYGRRYVLIGFATDFSTTSRGSRLYIAVSDTADPTGRWLTTQVPAPAGLHFDFPDVGFDHQGYYISANLFTYGFTLWGAAYRFVRRPDPASGGFSPIRAIDLDFATNGSGWAMRAVRQHGLENNPDLRGVAMFLGARAFSTTSLRLVKFFDPFATQTVRQDSDVSVMAYAPPSVDATQPALPCSSGPIDVLSSQLLNAEWRDGSIWTAHTVAGGSSSNIVQWFEVQTWPAAPAFWARTLQQGVISPPPIGEHAFSPAIAVNEDGEVAVVFTVSGSGYAPGVWVTGRSDCDSADFMAAPVEVRPGVSCIDTQQSQQSDPNRWGDYLGIVPVPDEDGAMFWAVGQYATRETSGTSSWNTHIQELEIADQCATCSCIPSDPTQPLPTHP